MPVNQLGTLSVPEATSIVISPWIGRCAADRQSDSHLRPGLNPTNDGKIVRVPIPPLTEDARGIVAAQVVEIDLQRASIAESSAAEESAHARFCRRWWIKPRSECESLCRSAAQRRIPWG